MQMLFMELDINPKMEMMELKITSLSRGEKNAICFAHSKMGAQEDLKRRKLAIVQGPFQKDSRFG